MFVSTSQSLAHNRCSMGSINKSTDDCFQAICCRGLPPCFSSCYLLVLHEHSVQAKHKAGEQHRSTWPGVFPLFHPRKCPIYCDLVTTSPSKPAPLLPLGGKKKSKEYSTRLCGQSTVPCGHLRFKLTVWPAWLPLW